MSNLFARAHTAYANALNQGAAQLIGMVQGMLADGALVDDEIHFLHNWLTRNEAIGNTWPGTAVTARLRDILSDAKITADERDHLAGMLQLMVGGDIFTNPDAALVNGLALDQVQGIDIADRTFCLTGEFFFGPRSTCAQAIERRGGSVTSNVSKKIHCVVVGGMGSCEWKHGSYGTKIERAMQLKAEGAPLLVVHEDVWAASL